MKLLRNISNYLSFKIFFKFVFANIAIKASENCKDLLKVKEIESWLTKVSEEEISHRKPVPELPKDDVCMTAVDWKNQSI